FGELARVAVKPRQCRFGIAPQGQLIVERGTRVEDRRHPIVTRLNCRGELQLQELLENAAHLATHRVALAFAQILDLLGYVLAIEAGVGGWHRAQHRRLVLGPGVEIIVVTGSVGHRRRLEARYYTLFAVNAAGPRGRCRAAPLSVSVAARMMRES